MFDLNVINAYLIVSIFTYNTYAIHDSNEDLLNVGTVLFSRTDLNKKRWDRTNIELLEARRYFQNLVPPPRPTDTLSEDYVNQMLKYFANAFSTVKREATDPEISDVMVTALSDVVGGFFRVWVLPVNKFAYYGGSISEDNAVKAFEFYDNLKINLNSDGNGWQKPSDDILNSIAISVIPFSHVAQTRSMKNPCEHLAYYEKYNDSLSIATPYINWEDTPNSMFLPLKNESLIILDSPSSSKALLRYYDVAKSCCNSDGPDKCKEFDRRFQDWLSNDVVPHLNDDKLYIAFGSVLTLLNKTKELFDSYACEMTSFPPCMTSKKFLILIVVLFLEIMWCIPTLLYIMCARKKSKMKSRTQFFLDAFRRRKSCNYKCQTIGRIDKSEHRGNFNKNEPKSSVKIRQPRLIETGVRLFQKPRARNTDIDTQCPSHTSKRSTGQVTESFPDIVNTINQSVMVINEIPIKSLLKKKSYATNTSQAQTTNSLITKDFNTTIQTESFVTVQKLEATITKIVRDKSGSNMKPCIKIPSVRNNIDKSHSNEKQKIQEQDKKDEDEECICPCICCIDEDRRNIESLSKNKKDAERKSKTKQANEKHNLEGSSQREKLPNTVKTKLPKLQNNNSVQKDIKLNKSKGLKFNTGEPLLEIRIDKPAAEITVDITKRSGASRKNAKPSKIPRRAPITNTKEEPTKSLHASIKDEYFPCVCTQQNYSTVKKRSTDDLDIKKKAARRKKMNVTL